MTAAEEGPLGDQLIDAVGDEHAVGVDPVARAVPRSRGVGQDEAQAADSEQGGVEGNDAHRVEAEPLAAPGELLLDRAVPGRGVQGEQIALDADRHIENLGDVAGQLARCGLIAPLEITVPRLDPDLGARLVQRRLALADGEGAVRAADPQDRGRIRCLRRAGADLDGVRHEESGEQADAELAEEFAPCDGEVVPLGQAPDGGQERAHFGIRQADPVVAHDHRGVVLGRHHLDHRNQRGVQATACLDRIPGILQQLAQLDALAAVQMMAKDVDDAA